MTTSGTTPVPAPEVLRYTAFSTIPSGGNPAGVVLDARALDVATMLGVALGHALPCGRLWMGGQDTDSAFPTASCNVFHVSRRR